VRRPALAGGERGAALVEAAIVTPLVAAAVAAVVVVAVLWRDQLAVADAAAAGARTAALYPSATADDVSYRGVSLGPGTPRVLAAVAVALGGVPNAAVERVVIFGLPAGPPPTAAGVPRGCRHGDGPAAGDACVVFDASALADPGAVPGCSPGACAWRDRPGVAVVGVLVRVRHPKSLGGLVPAPTLERVALASLEGGPDA